MYTRYPSPNPPLTHKNTAIRVKQSHKCCKANQLGGFPYHSLSNQGKKNQHLSIYNSKNSNYPLPNRCASNQTYIIIRIAQCCIIDSSSTKQQIHVYFSWFFSLICFDANLSYCRHSQPRPMSKLYSTQNQRTSKQNRWSHFHTSSYRQIPK